MIPEYFVVIFGLLMWLLGFMFGGILYAASPFWDGVRSVFGPWHKAPFHNRYTKIPPEDADPI